jgi:dTDP-4-dehydrorhamnose 3,5-epimerase
MIDGVITKELKLLNDDRGFLMEFFRCDDHFFEKFGQLYMTGCSFGIAKAWHYHKKQTDHFICVAGKALVVLHDKRKNSPTKGETQSFILEAPPCKDNKPILLTIPVGVFHGFTAIEPAETRIVNVPDYPYNPLQPDEFRFPWNSPEIPYIWPEYVKEGG